MLYGAVDEIKRNFAGNAVTIHGEGDFTGLPGVLEARRQDGDWRLSLAPGAQAQEVFRALAQRPERRSTASSSPNPPSTTYSSRWCPTMHKLWLVARREYLKCTRTKVSSSSPWVCRRALLLVVGISILVSVNSAGLRPQWATWIRRASIGTVAESGGAAGPGAESPPARHGSWPSRTFSRPNRP